MPAFFSATDDADEQALAVYGVVGRLDRPVAEVILRAGAYGHTLPIPWSAVFAGDAGLIRDLANPAAGPHRPDGQTGERAEDYGEVPGERWAGGPGRIASGGLRDAFRRGVRAFARGGIR
jgi:hypothetical protein